MTLRLFLDTNVLVHYVRVDRTWDRISATYQPFLVDPQPIISIVTMAEIRSLATRLNWEDRKLDRMQFAFDTLEVMAIVDSKVVDAYVEFDSLTQANGHKMGKNDLWIAASCYVTHTRLLTTDRDFDRLVPLGLERDWIDPSAP